VTSVIEMFWLQIAEFFGFVLKVGIKYFGFDSGKHTGNVVPTVQNRH
jgi:hypothetical protein